MSQHLHQIGKRYRTGAVDYGSDMVRWLGTDGQRSMERVYPFFAKPSWGLMEADGGIFWIYHRPTGYIVAQAEDVRYGKELVTRLHVKLPRFQMSSPPTEKQIGTVIRVKGQQEEKAEKERREAQARGTVQRRGVKDITQYEMFADLPPPRKEKSRKGAWSNAPALYRSLSLLWTDPALSLWAASLLDEDTEAAGWSEAEIEENGYPTRVEVMDVGAEAALKVHQVGEPSWIPDPQPSRECDYLVGNGRGGRIGCGDLGGSGSLCRKKSHGFSQLAGERAVDESDRRLRSTHDRDGQTDEIGGKLEVKQGRDIDRSHGYRRTEGNPFQCKCQIVPTGGHLGNEGYEPCSCCSLHDPKCEIGHLVHRKGGRVENHPRQEDAVPREVDHGVGDGEASNG